MGMAVHQLYHSRNVAAIVKMELFDYIEAFYNQRRRHSTLDQSGRV